MGTSQPVFSRLWLAGRQLWAHLEPSGTKKVGLFMITIINLGYFLFLLIIRLGFVNLVNVFKESNYLFNSMFFPLSQFINLYFNLYSCHLLNLDLNFSGNLRNTIKLFEILLVFLLLFFVLWAFTAFNLPLKNVSHTAEVLVGLVHISIKLSFQ